jgi:hypothetical protein
MITGIKTLALAGILRHLWLEMPADASVSFFVSNHLRL